MRPDILAAILAFVPLGEELEGNKEEREAQEKRRREHNEAATARWKAEQDAIAAPYREARRLRFLAKQEKQS